MDLKGSSDLKYFSDARFHRTQTNSRLLARLSERASKCKRDGYQYIIQRGRELRNRGASGPEALEKDLQLSEGSSKKLSAVILWEAKCLTSASAA
ncbi:hypothetical protein Q7C36_008633 [Tachysurus vachellii]|uniref:Uncharacterized protein n=1 Tax=Tachysurus vachellii TaxID=175792 RepID=A0AA88N1Z4_TACVA|nr:hypothetical protein Q7C36_008633 [Tachysurus vachellii]